MRRTWTISSLAAAVLAGAGPAQAKHGSCAFDYNQSVAETLILPALKQQIGPAYTRWSLGDPEKRRRDGQVELIFAPAEANAADTPDLVVMVDPCVSRVTAVSQQTSEQARERSPTPKINGKARRAGF